MPIIKPYAPNSNIIDIAFGYIAGIPNIIERVTGNITPTASPYCQPHIRPHKNTGICIGSIIFPISGICPVRKGRTYPIAINIAERVIFPVFLLFILILHFAAIRQHKS